MNSVKFGDIDSYKDWGILLRPKTRPKPNPKYEYVSIPARNGDLDVTEWAGDIFYENLSFPLEFYVIDAMKTWDEKIRTITNYLHGQKMKVTFSDDPDYYYLGRITVNEFSSDRSLGILTIECNFEPYKYKQEVTEIEYSVSAGNTYNFTNGRMKVVPTIEVSNTMTIEFEGTSYSLSAGSSKVLDIQFKQGINQIKVTNGTGTLKASYQEGDL